MKINQKIVDLVASGESMSSVARIFNITLSTVSRHCKAAGVKSSKETPNKELPLEEIKLLYINGESWYSLSKKYNIAAKNLKDKLLSSFPDLVNRSMDEAKRPTVLNDAKLLNNALKKQSIRSLAKSLNVKLNTVSAAVKRHSVNAPNRLSAMKINNDDLVYYYCQERKSIQWLCDNFHITRPNLLQRMDKLEIREGMRDYASKNPLLSDPTEIFRLYDEGESINKLSKFVGCSIGSIVHQFNKHKKQLRSLKEIYAKLRFENAKHCNVTTKWGVFNLQSNQELDFLNNLDENFDVEYESTTFHYGNRDYTPDFKVNGDFVEIKPKSRSSTAGVNRKDFVKQRRIAKLNGIDIKTWYDGEYFEASPDEDIDIYYADWRLFFDNHKQCSDWLLNYGFKPLKLPHMKLWGNIVKNVPSKNFFDANYPQQGIVDFIKHFNDHFWYSNRSGYLPIYKAFELGNSVILRDAVKMLWDKYECNIYSLVRFINKNYKDFMLPSVFKPWVASGVYDKFLPNGGTVYDPCIGWGGRLIGTMNRDIRYIGSDLNSNSVKNTSSIDDFLSSYLSTDNMFFQIDASKVTRDMLPEKIDMIFTSPPYDDTETYFGLDRQCQDTNPIYRNLFSLNVGLVILNVPQRHSDRLISIATECDYRLSETLEMKTAAPISRDKMFEPIHCFVRK